MIDDIERFIRRWLPSYEAQNRHYLTVAIGCTGGHHRSVAIAHAVTEFIKQKGYRVEETHRDISR